MGEFCKGKGRTGVVILAVGLCLSASAAQAAVEISAKPTANMTCSGGVCTPTAAKAALNVSDLAAMLASGDMTIKSTSQNRDIEINAAISWANTNRLTLDSYHAIAFNKPVEVTGGGAITITTNDGGRFGDYRFFGKGRIRFWDVGSGLTINGADFKLVKTIKQLHDYVHDNNGAGNYALANSVKLKAKPLVNAPIPAFSGIFDGLGNTISNLNINDRDDADVGLFGELTSLQPSTIRDVGLVNATVSGSGFGQSVGTLVGLISSGVVMNCYATGSAHAVGKPSVGGLVGFNQFGTIENSFAAVSVTVTGGGSAGGLVGVNAGGLNDRLGIVQTSYAFGATSGDDNSTVGGLVGKNSTGIVLNSYASGSASGAMNAQVGGLVGANVDDPEEQSLPAMNASYSTASVSGGSGSSVGGLVGSDVADALNTNNYWDMDTSGITDPAQGAGNMQNDPGIAGLSDVQLKSGLPSGFDKKTWKEQPKLNSGYPTLIDNPPLSKN